MSWRFTAPVVTLKSDAAIRYSALRYELQKYARQFQFNTATNQERSGANLPCLIYRSFRAENV